MGQWSKVFGTQTPTRLVPKWILQLLRHLDGFSSFCFGTKRKLLKSTVNSMYQTTFYDGTAITQALDFTYTPMDETQRRIAERYSMESPWTPDSTASISWILRLERTVSCLRLVFWRICSPFCFWRLSTSCCIWFNRRSISTKKSL